MTALLAVRILEGATAEFGVTGRAFVAAGVRAGGSLALDEPWDAALGAGVDAHWTRLPELGAYVREKARAVRMLVVVADQGAQIRREIRAQQHEPREMDAEIVEGSSVEGVHSPPKAPLSHNQIQRRRADEAVLRNAKDIAAYLHRAASTAVAPWQVGQPLATCRRSPAEANRPLAEWTFGDIAPS